MHFLAVCPKLLESRQGFMDKLGSILCTENSESNIRMVIENPQYLTQVILDSSVLAKDGLIEIDMPFCYHLRNDHEMYALSYTKSEVKSWVWPLGSRPMKAGCMLWVHPCKFNSNLGAFSFIWATLSISGVAWSGRCKSW